MAPTAAYLIALALTLLILVILWEGLSWARRSFSLCRGRGVIAASTASRRAPIRRGGRTTSRWLMPTPRHANTRRRSTATMIGRR